MIKQLSIFAIICMVTTLAEINKQTNTNGQNEEQSTKPNRKNEQHLENEKVFPMENNVGSILPPRNIPGYQAEEGLRPFNPYSSPQYGFYPNLQPIQPPIPQGFPVQPQILYYTGSGQPILINPGNSPGNFLIPQPAQPVDPNIFRNPANFPHNPVFPGGNYPPRQPVVPPIDKDAEEIPIATNPEVTPSNAPKGQKPQKIELDGEDESPKTSNPTNTKPNDTPPNIPPNHNFLNLRPGQRFFILNGQPLFSNYPQLGYFGANAHSNRYLQPYIARPQNFYPQQHPPLPYQIPTDANQFKQIGSSANIIHQNQPQIVHQHLIPQHLKQHHFQPSSDGFPLTLHNQVIDKEFQSVVLTKVSPSAKDTIQSRYYEKTLPVEDRQPIFPASINFDYYKYNDAGDEAAIIVDAKYQEPNELDDDVDAETEKPAESSVAEAQPEAIALAGEGGVAAAGPRGTALAGEGGLAVSSPHATAVAGPAKENEPANGDQKKPLVKTK